MTSTQCSKGSVQQDSKHCLRCPASQYSFQPSNSKCDSPCPSHANCTGAASMVPHKGYWVSAADSDSIVPCPNLEACQGNRDNLLQCLDQVCLLTASVVQSLVHCPTHCCCNDCLALASQPACICSAIRVYMEVLQGMCHSPAPLFWVC